MTGIFDWLIIHSNELIGTVVSLVYLYFSIRQKIWLWPLGLISSAIYVYVFFIAGIYADMGLQAYYVVISAYGWYNWKRMQGNNPNPSPVKSVLQTPLINAWLFIATLIIFILLSQILTHFTNSTIPYIDAFITALSITATWMLAKKYLENWLVWILVDAVSVAVYFYKYLYITILLYAIYTIFAVIGYFQWLKSYRSYGNEVDKQLAKS